MSRKCFQQDNRLARIDLHMRFPVVNNRMDVDLKSALEKAGMKPAELARRTGLSRAFISNMMSGRRSPSLANLRAISEALDIPPSELMPESTEFPAADHQNASSGFSEGAVTPFTPPPEKRRQWDALLNENDHTRTLYQLRHDCPVFSMCAGDILSVDMRRAAEDNEIVVTTEAMEDGSGTTTIRRLASPWLIAGTSSAPTERIEDDGRFSIVGVVRGVWRAL